MSKVPNVYTVFGSGAGPITPETVRKLARKEEELKQKYRKTPEWFRCQEQRINLMFSMVKGWSDGTRREVSFGIVALLAFALTYFLNPWDLVPDFLPLMGYIDDATVILWVCEMLKSAPKKYAGQKILDLFP